MSESELNSLLPAYSANLILALIAAAFCWGAKVKAEKRPQRTLWGVFWLLVALFHSVAALILKSQPLARLLNVGGPTPFVVLALINLASTSVVIVLVLLKWKKELQLVRASLYSFGISCTIALFDLQHGNGLFILMSAWLSFLILAWQYRNLNYTISFLLIAYAHLQIPGITTANGPDNLLLLLAAKLSLMGAVYQMLEVKKPLLPSDG